MSAEDGLLVCVVGPSGAGKDTLLRLLRSELADEDRFLFPPRWVTRTLSAHEDHIVVDEAAYAAALAGGRFALAWRAHGFGYAIAGDIVPKLAAGHVVICNVSREAIPLACRTFPRIATILITAPETVLAARLRTRGRETEAGIEERLTRNRDFSGDFAADFIIDNSGDAAVAAKQLSLILRTLVGLTSKSDK